MCVCVCVLTMRYIHADVTLARGSYFREDECKSDCSSLHEGSVGSAGDCFGDKVPGLVSGVVRSSEVSLDRTPSARST